MRRWARAAAAASLLAACGGGRAADPCGPPVYGGSATETVWFAMLDAAGRALVGDAKAPDVTVPSDGQTYPASGAAPQFSWSSPLASGDVYYLQIAVPDRACEVRVLTSLRSWQVDDASWAVFKISGGRALTLQITSAVFADGQIRSGPYRPAAPRLFRVTP